MWSTSRTATVSGCSERRVRASSRGKLLVEHPARREPRQRVGERQPGEPRAQRRVLDRHGGLRGEQSEHAARRVRQRLERHAPDHDQHAGHVAVAQHGLEHGRARLRGVHQRRRERGVRARVGDEVGLLGGERAARAGGVAARLDRHGRDVGARHRRRDEVAAGRLEQEGHRRPRDLARGLADLHPCVVAAGERARHAADRAHPAGLVAQHVVEAPQVALVALALQLGGQHAREHREQLLVGRLEGAELAAQRAERPDARAVGQLERHAEVGRGGHPLLHREPAVDRVLVDVVAHPRRAVLGHVRAERVAQRSREVRAQAELAALAGVDDPVDELAAVQVGEEERRVRHVALEQVEHGARGVGERAVAGGRGLRGSRDRARVHGGGLSPLATLPKIGYPSTLAA